MGCLRYPLGSGDLRPERGHPTVAIVGLPDLANETTGCPIIFEFQKNDFFLNCKFITNITQTYLGQKNLLVVDLKFKFN